MLKSLVSAHSSWTVNCNENRCLDKLTLNGQTLDGPSLPAAAVRREAEATDAPASSHSGAQDVIGVKVVSTLLKTPPN